MHLHLISTEWLQQSLLLFMTQVRICAATEYQSYISALFIS